MVHWLPGDFEHVRSDVVIVGYRLNAKEPAAKALERILGLSAEDARKLARGFPAVVARDLAEAQAQALAEQLKAAGAQVEVREHVELSVAQASTAVARAVAESGSRVAPLPKAALQPAPAPTAAALPAAPVAAALPAPPAPFFPAPTSAPLPTPASDVENSYTLGDFGLGKPKPANAQATVPAAPARAPGEDISLELDFASGGSLELDTPGESLPKLALGRAGGAAGSQGSDLHTLGGDFDDLEPTQIIPQIEERAARAIQRGPRTSEVRRSTPPRDVRRSTPPRDMRRSTPPSLAVRARKAIDQTLGSWLPSLLLLASLCVATLFAVGYALDPSDPWGALQRERAGLGADESAQKSEEPGPSATTQDARAALHPLLRATPSSIRGPLAAILRARIAGVHQVPVSFGLKDGMVADCMLVEQGDASEAERLAAVKQTGIVVEAPSLIAVQLREHARALQHGRGNGSPQLSPLCLTP